MRGVTTKERIAFVDAMRERGAVVVEVDGVRVTFPERAIVVEASPPPPPPASNSEVMVDDAERDRLMLWSST